MANIIYKKFTSPFATWTAPAGVKEITVTIIDNFNQLNNHNGNFSTSLKTDGSVWAWGLNGTGALGTGNTTATSFPVPVIGGHSFVKISSATAHVLALKDDGSVWTWGQNTFGNLGVNDITNRSSPVAIVGGHSFVDIAMGSSRSFSLKADGSVWGWGENASGQLGVNDIANRSSPVQVIGGHSFVSIGGGGINHSTTLKADGSAWTWGLNSSGQLGTGNTTATSSPVPVIGGHSFIKVSSGNSYSLALKADGSAWAWGLNSSGQLGVNDIANRSSPIQVIGGHSFINLSAGNSHSLALKADGSTWTWGGNIAGQLGIGVGGTGTNRSSPVQVIGGHSFVSIGNLGSSANIGMAIKLDGSQWTWGTNTNGELGDNTLISKSSPVQVTGGHKFQNRPKILNQRIFKVIPGQTYTINGFLPVIGGLNMNISVGNNIIIVIEYNG